MGNHQIDEYDYVIDYVIDYKLVLVLEYKYLFGVIVFVLAITNRKKAKKRVRLLILFK